MSPRIVLIATYSSENKRRRSVAFRHCVHQRDVSTPEIIARLEQFGAVAGLEDSLS